MIQDKLFSEFEEHFRIKLLSLADGTWDGVYSKCFMGFSKTQKTGIDLFLVSKERFFFAFYLFFDPIKLALSVCSPCVRLFYFFLFLLKTMEVGGSCVCGGGGKGVCWVKIGQKFDYIICEFVFLNKNLPQNLCKWGEFWSKLTISYSSKSTEYFRLASAWFDNLVNCCKWECKID